ncbi:beta-mannosidase protein [Roseibium sp. TrichSKD4]|nr:beta-mannosidase protein [Roseibium sp. TrichSKD4]
MHLYAAEAVLNEGWSLALTEPDRFLDPEELADAGLNWVAAKVPGTGAASLAEAGLYDPENPHPLHDRDVWYRTRFEVEHPGAKRIVFGGLATIAEVFLNGEKLLETESMFLAQEVFAKVKDTNTLAICFRALEPRLGKRGPRARWKTQLTATQGLRHFRTTLLGHMPGWCPEVHAVGPWRPITLHDAQAPVLSNLKIQSELLPDGAGRLSVSFEAGKLDAVPHISCAGSECAMTRGGNGRWVASVELADIHPWMPSTHGTPHVYEVALDIDGQAVSLGKTGFRRIEVDRGADGKGFGLKINSVPVFCRGAVWTQADLLGLSGTKEAYRPLLELARDAGMNMLRIGGTMTYKTRAFFDLCAELGILVWQDFQFANFDYPVADDAFADLVRAETRHQLQMLEGCPALAVLCGGSEIFQQGAMMGLPESRWRGALSQTLLADCAAELRPDVPYVENSPVGGHLPFSANEGIAHYYGVGAYQQPLEDARRANVRFTTECLAFSNVPTRRALEQNFALSVDDPRWKAGIPRDRGADWDFEDVRNHYLKRLYDIEGPDIRDADPERYLDLSRAVVADVLEATISEWRRSQSSCQGALVWTFQDVATGAGWGVVDAAGHPKSAYYALKRSYQPLHVALIDEGTNGVQVHLTNDTPLSQNIRLEVTCLRGGAVPVVKGQRDLVLTAQAQMDLPTTDLFGAFFDTGYVFKFGPASHDVVVARLIASNTDLVLSEAVHFPLGFSTEQFPLKVSFEFTEVDGGEWVLSLETEKTLRFVQLDFLDFRTSDDGFTLVPGRKKQVRLKPEPGTEHTRPQGSLRALNGLGELNLSPDVSKKT